MGSGELKRILLFTEHFRASVGGAEKDAVDLAQALLGRGYEVHVVAESGDEDLGPTLHRGLASGAETAARLAPDLSLDWGFYHCADAHRAIGGLHEAFLRYKLRGLSGLGARTRDWLARRGKHAAIVRRQRAIVEADVGSCFLPLSRFVAGQLVAAGIPESSIRVLYNAVDTRRFDPARIAGLRQSARREWGLAEDDVVFLFVAHNLQLKNLRLLRAVFASFEHSPSNLRLLVVGKRRPEWRAPWLVYAGEQAQIERCYAAADALLHPSWYDSFGNVIVEAMSCGLAVAVSDCCGAAELIADGRDGRVLPVDGPPEQVFADWRQTVGRLARDVEFRQACGFNARATALRHDVRDYCRQFEESLQACYRNKRRSLA